MTEVNGSGSRRNIWIKMAIPLLLGGIAVLWLFHNEYEPGTWSSIRFTGRAVVGIALAWMFMGGRDFGLMWRFRSLTDRHLSWRQALKVTMLCEFTSAITPSTVGGSALGMIFMHREGIDLGRATTLMLVTLFLDELFFVVLCPLVFLAVPSGMLFGFGEAGFVSGLKLAFWLVYAGIAVWTAVLFWGIFVRPQAVRRVLNALFSTRLLRRWQSQVADLGDNMVNAGRELRHRTPAWWCRVSGATVVSWLSRFMIVNALFFGFVGSADQLLVLARQFVVWLVLMVSPTPGGSGVSEWLFTDYYGDVISSAISPAGSVAVGATVIAIAMFWRIISYYIYLLIGIFLVPSFLKTRKNSR
ncbi:MAG: flippase-like domain-containing protein [Muribaculaceae bacterium]|nr:flippase-like domain-containing protein [Muribaculaceae bacterium]